MTGLFADHTVNPASVNGAFYGRPIQLWYQIAGILTAIGNRLIRRRSGTEIICSLSSHGLGFGGACTAGILLPLKYTIGIRLSPEEELRGLDYIGKLIFRR